MWGLRVSKTVCVVFVFCVVAAIPSPAQTFKSLLSFDGTNGEYPYAGLIQGTDGNFYGTTAYGGADSGGSVFKITPKGTLTTVYSFCSKTGCADGGGPLAGLLLSSSGNFYGTTYDGGGGVGRDCGDGCGTVFEISATGAQKTLYTFCSQMNCADGSFPYAGLVQATNGGLYGTTASGGAYGFGTIFEIPPIGGLEIVHSFDQTDGSAPTGTLVQGTDGNLYGTTTSGGTNGGGTVFKMTLAGTLTTLHSFCSETSCQDGDDPYAGLVQASNGSFYGTTVDGGGANDGGTVFKITLAGVLTTLYTFCTQSNCTDGFTPQAGLVQGTNGDLYGATEYGGANLDGTVFKITPAGVLTTLYSFCSQTNCSDGSYPYASLVQSTNGSFYGTTSTGGSAFIGTVFSVSVGLKPFVETLPTSGKVGANVVILGNGLTGSTSVSFNGTAATFTVVKSTEIKTTVPAGATTGEVEVVTPSNTLKSNVVFRVTP